MAKKKGIFNNLFGIGIEYGEDELEIEKNPFIKEEEHNIKETKNEEAILTPQKERNMVEDPYQTFLEEEKQIVREREISNKNEKDIIDVRRKEMAVDTSGYQNIVTRVKRFEDGKKIAEYIKRDKIVTLNLEDLDNKVAQKVIDFLSGAMSMKDASFVEISKHVYVSVPKNQRVLFEGQRGIGEKNIFREAGK